MQSEIEDLSGLQKKIKVKVPQQQIQDEFNKRINDLAKKVNIKGFRKGKVPAAVVKLQYGEAVRQEVIQEVLWNTLQEAFKEKNVNPAGMPQIEIKSMGQDSPFEYEASFEVYPEVKLDLTGIAVERQQSSVEDQHVNDVIEKLRKQNVKWVDADRAAQTGDMLEIDFDGFFGDEPIKGASAKGFRLELGSHQMIPGFEDALLGAKAGDTVTFNVTFPEDYHAKDNAGKEAKFVVPVHKVLAPEYPEVNDSFANDLGVSGGTVEALHKEVRDNLEQELERRIKTNLKEQLINQLLEKNKIEVPQSSVDAEIKRLQEQFKKQWAAQTGRQDVPQLPNEQVEDQARKNVILGLLFTQWIEDKQLKVDNEKVKKRIEEISAGYHQPHEIVNWYYSNKEALRDIEASVLEDQALDTILQQINVTDTPTSFEEIMNIKDQQNND